jgi:PiT family inorganic phosphate transporter
MLGLIPLFIAGAYVGWNIGANDAGNCVGTTVGSGLLSYRRAVLLVAAFALFGALLQGQEVMSTVGKGIVTSELPSLAVLTAMLSAGIFVTIATFFKIPVSTSQAIVGGVTGVGLAVGADLDTSVIMRIVEVWIVCPILVGVLAAAIYSVASRVLRRISPNSIWQRIPHALLILSACYISFSLGANHVGTAMGPITNLGVHPAWLSVLGGVAVAAGVLTFGRRVTQTVGGGITPLDMVSAFSAQMAAALAVHFFSIVGIPVSTSQSIVGALLGVGLLHGIRAVRMRKIGEIAVGWVATPTAAGLFSYGLYRLLSLVFG